MNILCGCLGDLGAMLAVVSVVVDSFFVVVVVFPDREVFLHLVVDRGGRY